MEYHDWLPYYPKIIDSSFQQKIAAKKEFEETETFIDDPNPSVPGELFKYQEFVKRYMRHYDRFLLYFEAGVGKSCAYISVGEDFKLQNLYGKSLLADALDDYYNTYKGIIKNTYVLFKSKTLVNEFKKQLVCKCTAGTYITDSLRRARTEQDQKVAVSRAVNKNYIAMTYVTFVNRILKDRLSDEQLRERFSNCIFVCDEIHSIRNDLDVSEEEAVGLNQIPGLREEMAEMSSDSDASPYSSPSSDEDIGTLEVKPKSNKLYSTVYNTLWKIFHKTTWCKVIAASATPMINDVRDIIDPMNLLLPTSKQIPENSDPLKWTEEDYMKYCNGYVSFVRASDIGINEISTGTPIPKNFIPKGVSYTESLLNVEQYQMSKFQSEVYLKHTNKNNEKGWRIDERQISLMIFPDGSYGGSFPRQKIKGESSKNGISRYVNSPSKDVYVPKPEFLEKIKTLEDLEQYSVLYANIIRQGQKAPGPCFIYLEYLNGSGAIALAMCMQALGVKRFRESNSPFSSGSQKKLASYCGANENDEEQRVLNLEDDERYYLMSSESSVSRDDIAREVFNSRENMTGKKIRYFIGTRMARDGINLANVQDVFLAGIWTPAGMYQAIRRAIRATSHVHLLETKESVDVRIHRIGSYAVNDNKKKYSVELDMFALTEKKDRSIAVVRRNFRRFAADCHTQYHRNNKESEELDYTAACDYDVCEVPCVTEKSDTIDYSTYRLFYFNEFYDSITSNMDIYFSVKNYIKLDALSEDNDRELCKMAIEKAIQDKRVFYDKLGRPAMLACTPDYHYIWLVPFTLDTLKYTYNGSNNESQKLLKNQLDNFYSASLYIQQTIPLNELASKQKLKVSSDYKDPDIGTLIVENAIIATSNGKELTKIEKDAMKYYHHYIYKLTEPVKELKRHIDLLEAKSKGRGRKKTNAKIDFHKEPINPEKYEKEQPEGSAETVWVHTIGTIPRESVSYNVSARVFNLQGSIFLYKPSEHKGWRDLSDTEVVIYNSILRGYVIREFNALFYKGIFGSVLTDGVFRIHDMREAQSDPNNMRSFERGLKVSSLNPVKLMVLGKLLGIPIQKDTKEAKELLNKYKKRDEKIAYLRKKFKITSGGEKFEYTDDDLKYVFHEIPSWKRDDYTDKIYNILKDTKSLYISFGS